MAQQQPESYQGFVHRITVRWNIFRIQDKFKDPATGFPQYGSDDDWLLRRVNTDKHGWVHTPEVSEGFTTILPAGTVITNLEDESPIDGAPMFKSICPITGNVFCW
jgi:hypothetical protein